MKKLKFATIIVAALTFSFAFTVYAESNDDAEPQRSELQSIGGESHEKVETKQPTEETAPVISSIRVEPVRIPEKSTPQGMSPGYEMVTDVLDGFGRASSSAHYQMAVNSGGQPSAVGVSSSTSYTLKSGYVYSSYVYRGDANADAVIDVGDVVYLINYLYRGGPEPRPIEAGNVNGDGVVDVGDVVYLINYLFKGGPPPAC